MRETGILLPLSALPSRMGIGDMGDAAYEFMDLISKKGVSIWQLLPLNPMGYGNSPYQPYSSFAGDEIYISLELLFKEGLIGENPPPFREMAQKVDYKAVRDQKEPYLKEAFGNFEETKEYQEFKKQDWVYTYAVFMAFKKASGGLCWNEWPGWQQTWPEKREGDLALFGNEIEYQIFLQYLFYCQWMKLKQFAGAHGIKIMGDVPFYVGLDSADVWARKENFLLDSEGKPAFVAGVPPDYFSATGQRWGNPIYDWKHIQSQDFKFWLDRLGYNSHLFNVIRIDHFRAFDTYWKIPASCPTAVEGKWVEAPGYEALGRILEEVPEGCLVAEDLGDLRPEVTVLKDHFGLKGMKVLQFTINLREKYGWDEVKDRENMIFYTGTHDNTTLRDWYESQSAAGKRKLRRFLKSKGFKQGCVIKRLILYVLESRALYAVIPMADILELGALGRLNTPGTVGSPNWEWKMNSFSQARRQLAKLGPWLERDRGKET